MMNIVEHLNNYIYSLSDNPKVIQYSEYVAVVSMVFILFFLICLIRKRLAGGYKLKLMATPFLAALTISTFFLAGHAGGLLANAAFARTHGNIVKADSVVRRACVVSDSALTAQGKPLIVCGRLIDQSEMRHDGEDLYTNPM